MKRVIFFSTTTRSLLLKGILLANVSWALFGQTPLIEAFEMIKNSDPSVSSQGILSATMALQPHSSDWGPDTEYLLQQMGNSSGYIRQQALGLLATAAMLFPQFILTSESQEPIYKLLLDPVTKIRVVAITTLGYLQLPKPHLTQEQADQVSKLVRDENLTVRKKAVNAMLLEKPLREKTIALAIERFNQDPEVQDTVIEILGKAKIDTNQSAVFLRELLKARTGSALIEVLETIQQISGQTGLAALPEIRRLSAESDDGQVRSSAATIISKIEKGLIQP